MMSRFDSLVVHLYKTGKSINKIAKIVKTSKGKVTKVLVDNNLHKITHRKVRNGKANCTRCGKPFDVKGPAYVSKFVCKVCLKKEQRQQQAKRRGITEVTYTTMLSKQNNKCAICGDVESSGRRLAIDHDHETGKVRALLCSKCNRGLGFFRDSAYLLKKASEYLNEHS